MLKFFAESEVVRFLTVVSLFLALPSVSLDQLPFWVEPLLLAGIAFAVGQTFYNIRSQLLLAPMPEANGMVTPFASQTDFVPWQRSVAGEIAEKIMESHDRHLLLIAPSGAGKSILLDRLIGQHIPGEMIRCETIEEYETPILSLLNEIEKACQSEAVSKALYPFIEHDRARRIFSQEDLNSLENAIISAIDGKKLLFVFDQVERYFALAQKQSLSDYDQFLSTTEAIKTILSCVRRSNDARSVFAIRSEFFFGSLGQLFNTGKNGENIEKIVDFFFMYGANFAADQTVRAQIDSELRKSRGMSRGQSNLYTVSRFDIPEHSDTFTLRLGLFLLGAIESHNPAFKRAQGSDSADEYVDILLDLSFNAFVKAMPMRPTRNLFDTVLYALALENKVIGNAASLSRIAGLAHFPLQEVKDLVLKLKQHGVVLEQQFEGESKFRISHDRISDRILSSDLLDINSITTESLRFLTEPNNRHLPLTIPNFFPKALETSMERWFSVSYVSIVMFIVFGLCRLSFPVETSGFVHSITAALGIASYLPQPSYYFDPIYYLPHFFCHVAWVSFIDRVYRGYLRNIPIKWFAVTASLFAGAGVLMGVFVSFTPSLFFVPIAVVGLALGVLAVVATLQLSLKGETRRKSLAYGVRTAINMVMMIIAFSFLLQFHLDLVLVQQIAGPLGVSAEEFLLALIYVESAGLLWFWAHIRAEQNTPKIWSAYLALLDKGLSSR
jgi:hypothetical protein